MLLREKIRKKYLEYLKYLKCLKLISECGIPISDLNDYGLRIADLGFSYCVIAFID